jgi:hypothetical protein
MDIGIHMDSNIAMNAVMDIDIDRDMTINVTMYIHEHENENGHGYGHDAHVCLYTHRDLPKEHVYNIMQSILEERAKLTHRHPKVDIYFMHLGTSWDDDTLPPYRRPCRPRHVEQL